MGARIVINATTQRGPVALPVLLESLRLANIPMHTVTIVCPGALPAELGGVEAGVHMGPLTGLVHASEHAGDITEDWVLYLHETSVVGESFLRRLDSLVNAAAGLKCVALSNDVCGYGAGLYSVAWLGALGLRDALAGAPVHSNSVTSMCEPEHLRCVTTKATDMGVFRYSETDEDDMKILWYPELDVYEFRLKQ